MKKILSMLMLSLLFLAGCSGSKTTAYNGMASHETPPELIVTSGDKSITAVIGTYSWCTGRGDRTVYGIREDPSAPPELIKYQRKMLTVKPGSLITLNFRCMPDECAVSIWEGSSSTLQYVDSGRIIVPKKNGLIVYEVYAKYRDGSVHYAFTINGDSKPAGNGAS